MTKEIERERREESGEGEVYGAVDGSRLLAVSRRYRRAGNLEKMIK